MIKDFVKQSRRTSSIGSYSSIKIADDE